MDNFQARAIASRRNDHRVKIGRSAEKIRALADCILRDLDSGRTSGDYAGDVLANAQTIVTGFAMLEAMADVTGIVDATEDWAVRIITATGKAA